MDLRSHIPPLGNFRQPPTTLSDEMLLLDALLMRERLPHADAKRMANDVVASHQIRICAEALQLAVDAMHDSPATADIDTALDQLERVQEAAGRAILALVNSRREAIIAGYIDDDDEDEIDTVTIPEPAAQADPKGGAA